GRGQHDALDALWVGIDSTKVGWVPAELHPALRDSATSRGSRDLAFEVKNPLLELLAFDMRIRDLRIASEAAEQFALLVVQVGSGLVAAIEGDREATPRIAHGRAENGPLDVARQAPDGRTESPGRVEAERPAAQPAGERRLAWPERIGVHPLPSRARAPPEDAVLLPKDRGRSQAQRAHRLVHQKAFDVGESAGASNLFPDGGEPMFRQTELPIEQPVGDFGHPFMDARDQEDETGGDQHPGPVRQARP